MTNRPLYVSIAVVLESLKTCRDAGLGDLAESNYIFYLQRCARALPFHDDYGAGPAIDTTNIRPDLIAINGIHAIDHKRSKTVTMVKYGVRVTPSLITGFQLRVLCGERNLRQMLMELFATALRTEYPSSDLYLQKETPHHVVHPPSEKGRVSDLH